MNTTAPQHDTVKSTRALQHGVGSVRRALCEAKGIGRSPRGGTARRRPRAERILLLAGGDSPASRAGSGASWIPEHVRPYIDRIRFLGWLSASELHRQYRAADVLVVPSRYEPFGMVVLEGMAHGLPIVAAAVDGPAEILADGRTGLLFAPGDVSGLAETLARLLADRALSARLGVAAHEEVRVRWGWNEMLPPMLAAYRHALGHKAAKTRFAQEGC
jgi:glycosyltransferase involved in cell wall biosynthesis